jgi:hypothetical protein
MSDKHVRAMSLDQALDYVIVEGLTLRPGTEPSQDTISVSREGLHAYVTTNAFTNGENREVLITAGIDPSFLACLDEHIANGGSYSPSLLDFYESIRSRSLD